MPTLPSVLASTFLTITAQYKLYLPRFLPDEIVEIQEVPRTLSGKKLEVPVKKLLLGSAAEKVVNRDSMSNPNSFDFFIDYARHKTKKDHI